MSKDQEKLIEDLVDKGLAGDMEPINAIEDRILRGKVKSALVKAKRAAKAQEKIENKDTKVEVLNNPQKTESTNAKISDMINKKFPGSLENEGNDKFIQLKPEHWFEISKWLRSEPSLFFDSLQCQTGVDIGDNNLEARYNFHSMKHGHYIEVRIAVPRNKAVIPSVEQIWRVADWFERETYDMLGIEFSGHRDLRRILLPDDWEGWPLRKDYQVQETYHGIVVPKMKEGWE
jgi:NADH-quinone oxidoreductase subunit C